MNLGYQASSYMTFILDSASGISILMHMITGKQLLTLQAYQLQAPRTCETFSDEDK